MKAEQSIKLNNLPTGGCRMYRE